MFAQLSLVLHLCLVQQHRHRWTAPPAGAAADQRQLQRNGARGSDRSEGQNRTQSSLGPHHRHGCVLPWLPQQLERIPDHGRNIGAQSPETHRSGLDVCLMSEP